MNLDPKPTVLHNKPVVWIRIRSGSRRAKMTHKNRKRLIDFIFWCAGCSLLRAKGFSCSLDVLFSAVFFLILVVKLRVRIRIHLKCWIRFQWIRIHITGINYRYFYISIEVCSIEQDAAYLRPYQCLFSINVQFSFVFSFHECSDIMCPDRINLCSGWSRDRRRSQRRSQFPWSGKLPPFKKKTRYSV